MDFGNVILEHRPVVICQCKIDLCISCNTPSNDHDDEQHIFTQRMKTFGPRVVIDQSTHIGKCHDCGKEYMVNLKEVVPLVT